MSITLPTTGATGWDVTLNAALVALDSAATGKLDAAPAGATTSTTVLAAKVTGDAQSRFTLRADGRESWGPGSGAVDTTLYRSGVGALTTDGALSVGGALAVTGSTTLLGNLAVTGIGQRTPVLKSADESLTSNTTLQNDDHLLLAVTTNAKYLIRALIFFTASTTGAIKFAWTGPAGATMIWGSGNTETSAASIGASVSAVPPSTSLCSIELKGVLVTSSTAGNLQLQWAQNASSATATVVKANSLLIAERIA